MNVVTVYEIAGFIATVLTAIYTYIHSESDKKRDTTIFISALGVTLTLMLSVRYDLMPKMVAGLYFEQVLSKDVTLKDAVEKLARAESDNPSLPQPIGDIKNDQITRFKKTLEDMAQDHYVMTDDEMTKYASGLIEGAHNEIFATSYVQEAKWWETSWGSRYEQANEKKAEAGIKITRIFIFSTKEDADKKTRNLMQRELKAKITVKYILADQLDSKYTGDMILIDSVLAGRLQLTAHKEFGDADFYTNPEQIADIRDKIDSINARATECGQDRRGNLICDGI